MKNIRILKLFGTFTVCCLILFLSSAHASILTFDGVDSFGLQNGSYGDNVNSTSQGSYSYGVGAEGFTPNVIAHYWSNSSPEIWPSTYGDLVNVIYSSGGGSLGVFGGILEVQLTADPGYLVQLYNFDMAGWYYDTEINSVEVLNSDRNSLFTQNNAYIEGDDDGGPRHTHFDFTGSPLTDDQLTIRFDSTNLILRSDDIGMDNIRFGQTEVPILGAVWLLGSGLIALAGIRKKFKK